MFSNTPFTYTLPSSLSNLFNTSLILDAASSLTQHTSSQHSLKAIGTIQENTVWREQIEDKVESCVAIDNLILHFLWLFCRVMKMSTSSSLFSGFRISRMLLRLWIDSIFISSLGSLMNLSRTGKRCYLVLFSPRILESQWRLEARVLRTCLSWCLRSLLQVAVSWDHLELPRASRTAGKLYAQEQTMSLLVLIPSSQEVDILLYASISWGFISRPFRVWMYGPNLLQAAALISLLVSFKNSSMIQSRTPSDLTSQSHSSEISSIISIAAFLKIQLDYLILSRQNYSVLALKNSGLTTLASFGTCKMACFLTFWLLSSPRDQNQNPTKCSHRSLPNNAAILARSITAITLLSSLLSSCANSRTHANTLSPTLYWSKRVANCTRYVPASLLISGSGS